MIQDTDTLYGNEWIHYSQDYFKIKVAEDGMYRLTFADLDAAGVFSTMSPPQGQNFQLYKNGASVPLYVSELGAFSNNDYIAFYGQKNRGEIDKYLYDNPNYQLNPEYSLYTDTAVYYLTWTSSVNPDIITSIPNDLNNLPAKEGFCWYEKTLEWHQSLNIGKAQGGSGYVSAKYDIGEGYAKSTFNANQSVSTGLSSRYTSNDAPNAQVEVQVLAEGGNHYTEIQFNNIVYATDTFSDWAVKRYQFEVPMSATTGSSPLRVKGSASSNDRYRLAYIKVKYPRQFSFANEDFFRFQLDSSWHKQYLEILNFNHGGVNPVLYDLTNKVQVQTQISGSKILVTIPPSSLKTDLVLVSDAGYKVASIESVNFSSFSPNQGGNYIILSHSKLFDDGNGMNYIQDYANYRASNLGGSFTPVVVDIDQVYDQFGYGIDRHEQSIRNFVQWAIKYWGSEYLFIIGKGVYYGKYRDGDPDFEGFELVPSFGYPTSDNLLTAKSNSDIPMMAVGRVAAYTPDMVRIYLDKVKEIELAYQTEPQTIGDRAWMKNFLHLGGGDANIQTFIKSRLVAMEDTIRQSKLGGNVLAYYKNSTNVVQNANSDDVTQRINEGLAWITFFGHSAPNTLDFDIGDPYQYDNQGKYPMIYAMGCNTNRLFETSSTLSEKYVFVEDKGAIGFIGSTATTSLSDLNEYGKILYQNLGNNLYGQPIGKIMKQTIEDYPLGGYWGALVKHNILLHGDPGLRIYPQQGADYIINKAKTTIEPNYVNVLQDSFYVNLVINNIGSTSEDSINVLIEHQYPDGSKISLKTIRIKSPKYEEVHSIWLPLENKDVIGMNELHITLDLDDEIIEVPVAAEQNNFEVIPFTIISNSAVPIFPYEYGIHTTSTVTLKASTANILSENIQYYIEIDTAKTFDSPSKLTTQKESQGGLITWKPTLTLSDSTVYFWRISIDSTFTSGNGFDWQYSSFVYIPQGRKGWSQSHFYQKSSDSYLQINVDTMLRTQVFDKKSKELKVVNGTFPMINFTEASLYLDGFKEFTFWPCNTTNNQQVALVAILDKNALSFQTNPFNNNISPNCWGVDLHWYIFNLNTTTERQKLIDSLQSVSPDDYVAMFITQRLNQTMNANQWAADSTVLGTNVFQVLENQGATLVRQLETDERPYVLIFQKDNPNWSGFREAKAVTSSDILEVATLITGKQTSGSITSTPIGPAASWGDVEWQVTDFNPLEDTISLDVIGVTADGADSVLMTGVTMYDLSLDFVNSSVYPYLKLRYNVKDETSLTPAQLDYWRVYYESFPDAALNPDKHLVFHADTIQQGDKFQFEIGVENISNIDMDSLLVRYVVTDVANNETEVYVKNEPLLGDSSLITKLDLETINRSGSHLLNIEINPNDDQPEQYKFNNNGVTRFYIKKDETPPILDVTFDGVHIMNGDIVSAKPNILIALKDDNEFLALSDTSTFELYILSPSGVTTRHYVDNQIVIFRPADISNLENENRAEIEFLPEFTEDGTYQLQIKAKDATNNLSGENQYKIDFEVVTKAMISNVLNYPNPFSTSTQFVFTLTGAEVPESMNIQIFTVSGKVVRTITKEELGEVRIGLNRTTYSWDGTDDFGNKLANGVYLYRVNLKSATDESYELFNTGTNDFFQGGFGKMVILR